MRRYKFKKDIKIPTTATPGFFETVKGLVESGKSFLGYHELQYIRMDKTVYMFSPDWLEEIEEDPVSAEEAGDKWFYRTFPDFKSQFDDGTTASYRLAYIDGHTDGEANNELRHRPQQTFREWTNDQCVELQTLIRNYSEAFNEIWNASDKNRGF